MKATTAAGFLGLCLLTGPGLAVAASCDEWSAEVLVVEGVVEIRRAGQANWTPIDRGDRVCQEEPVRSGRDSRATFLLPGETRTRLDAESSIAFNPGEEGELTVLSLLRGLIYVLSRDPRALTVRTPFGDAGLEGTEFQIAVSEERLDLIVFEGTVLLEEQRFGTQAIEGTRRIVVDADGFGELADADPAQRELLWALRYARVVDGPLPGPNAAAPGASVDPEFLVRRAQNRILLGRTTAARMDIEEALAADPDNPEALALAAMVSRAERDLSAARDEVDRALTRDPESVAALIADTYLLEERALYTEALVQARRAVARENRNVLARVRLAELLLETGDIPSAVRAAQDVQNLAPDNAAAFSVLGFAALAAADIDTAQTRFEQAIEFDAGASLPRLGLAIALIRSGEMAAAIDQLETAVSLDPNNSAFRSYMAKAYFDGFDPELAAAQLAISKRVNSLDATPYTYRAMMLLDSNDPIGAIRELDEAEARAGRPQFGSTFAFDEDPAMTNAGRGGMFRSINHESLASLSAAEALVFRPTDSGAHWLLAEVASWMPRQQYLRISETRQARMHQSLNTSSMPPQLGLVNLHIMDSSGPTELARLQPRSSFVRNGIETQVSAVTASNGTRGQNALLSGNGDQWSFDIGHGNYETNGFRDNNDFRHEVTAGFVQGRVGPRTTFMAEARAVQTEKGDLPLLFSEEVFSPLARQSEEDDSLTVGFSTRLAPSSTVLGSLTLGRLDVGLGVGDSLAIDGAADRGILDLQYVKELESRNVVAGIRLARDDYLESVTSLAPVGSPPVPVEVTTLTDRTGRHLNAYVYLNQQLGERFHLTVGGAYGVLHGQLRDRERFSPKLGLMWRAQDTVFRVAYFETLQGPQIAKQLIQPLLEPTLVSGFSQYIFGVEGEVAGNYALGIDHAFTPDIRISAERRERSLDSPFGVVDPGSATIVPSEFGIRESIDRLDLFWTPRQDLALRAGWQYENFDYNGNISPFQFTEIRTKRLPVEVTWLVGELLSVELTGTHIRQAGVFDGPGPFVNLAPGESQFSVFDAAVNFRLPRRRGTVEIGIRNLFDEDFRFQDTDPENPRVYPERFLLTRFSLLF